MVSICKHDQHFDISLPIPLIGDMIESMYQELMQIPEVIECYIFGHVADGNIHLVVDKKNLSDELTHRINTVIYSPLKAVGGSISAEHGIGLHKKRYLYLCRSEAEIQLMKTLKSTLDPNNILNPKRILD